MLYILGSGGLASFVASLGFGILFNIKGKNLLLAGIGGGISGMVYKSGLACGCSEMMAMFLASLAFSVYSELMARICKTPVTTYIVCALIPLVPGGGMYRMMQQAIFGDVDAALSIGLDTLLIAGVLAFGILIASTLMRALFPHDKRKVRA